MDQCTLEVRLQHWKDIISQCHSRPSGQSAKQWLKANGICEATYYSWQRKIRQLTYDSVSQKISALPEPVKREDVSFAEVPFSTSKNDSYSEQVPLKPVAVIKTARYSVALTADIPESILSRILQEASHA